MTSSLPGGLCGVGFRLQGGWGTGPRKAACLAAWLRRASRIARGPSPRLDPRVATQPHGQARARHRQCPVPAWVRVPCKPERQPGQEYPVSKNVSQGFKDHVTGCEGPRPLSNLICISTKEPLDSVGDRCLGLWPQTPVYSRLSKGQRDCPTQKEDQTSSS